MLHDDLVWLRPFLTFSRKHACWLQPNHYSARMLASECLVLRKWYFSWMANDTCSWLWVCSEKYRLPSGIVEAKTMPDMNQASLECECQGSAETPTGTLGVLSDFFQNSLISFRKTVGLGLSISEMHAGESPGTRKYEIGYNCIIVTSPESNDRKWLPIAVAPTNGLQRC